MTKPGPVEFPEPQPVVEVEWIDSCHGSGWTVKDEARAEAADESRLPCRTAGYLFRDGRNSITVALSMGAMGQTSDTMTIPRLAITRISYLKKK